MQLHFSLIFLLFVLCCLIAALPNAPPSPDTSADTVLIATHAYLGPKPRHMKAGAQNTVESRYLQESDVVLHPRRRLRKRHILNSVCVKMGKEAPSTAADIGSGIGEALSSSSLPAVSTRSRVPRPTRAGHNDWSSVNTSTLATSTVVATDEDASATRDPEKRAAAEAYATATAAF